MDAYQTMKLYYKMKLHCNMRGMNRGKQAGSGKPHFVRTIKKMGYILRRDTA